MRPRAPLLEAPSDPFPDRPSLSIVQLAGPTRDAWLADLRLAGVEPLQYVPELSFISHGTPAAVERARGLAFVRWIGPFPPLLKLPPALREIAKWAVSGPAAGPAAKAAAADPLDVIIQLFEVGDSKDFRRFLAGAGARELWASHPGNRVHLRALVPRELLAPLARWPSVFRIEKFPRLQLYGERAAATSTGAFPPEDLCVTPGYEEWLDRKGVRGDGVLVQVMDDGIEQGDASGVPGSAHPDILGAIVAVDNATGDPEADSRAGHGSLSAGLIAGRAVTGIRDADGFLLGQGTAPGAMLFGTKIFNNLGRFDTGPRSFSDLAGRASQRGAMVSSNSWGASIFGEYDALSAEFDALARDAHADPGFQPMTFIFAAGNEGDDVPGGTKSIGSPATAKNVISTGASEGCDDDGRDGCGIGPTGADSIRDVPEFSSRGPQADGRLGPVIVAPGTHVSGIASTATGYDGTGICDPFWPEGQALYARGSGTSHACPLVAGAAALFHESYLSRTGEAPSPALVRAALAASARDIAGGEDGHGGKIEPIPNDVQGWGRLSMEDLLPDRDATPRAVYFDQRDLLGDSGDVWETVAFPLDPAQPVKIALAWSDPPALPGADPVLVNDLDLEVESGERLYRGNVFDGGSSAPDGESDRRNNLECAFLASPGPVLRIRVRAAAISGDGALAGDGTDQDFALVVLGGTLQSSRGVVSFRRGAYACDAIVGLTLSDLDMKGKPEAQILVSSDAAEQPIVAALSEVNTGTGVFDGTVQLGKNAGELVVQDLSTITARYLDANTGTGTPGESIATARVDCAAPAISDVNVNALTESSAVVSWTTSEEATGKVLFGTDCAQIPTEATAPRQSRAQSVVLSGLSPGTQYFFTVISPDLVGNSSIDDNGGRCHSFHTSSLVCGFQDDVEPVPLDGWTHGSSQGPDDWAPAVFRGAHSPANAWHAEGFDGFKDSFLVTPPLDIEVGDLFSFWHSFQLEKGYDGAILEISTSGGTQWNDLGPFITRGGYVEIVSGSPLSDRMAWTGQRHEDMSQVEVDLASWAGRGRIIRFRMATDASFADGFGWYIDDAAVCHALNKRGKAALDRGVYRCGDRVHVQVGDVDLVGTGSVNVQASSPSHPDPVPVTLAETVAGSGVLAADLLLDGAPGGLGVAHGDEIAVEYVDLDDGSGDGSASVVVKATVDCQPPAISGVRIVELLDDEATIVWETDEPTIDEVTAGAACDAPTIRVPLPMAGVSHAVTLGGLDSALDYHFKITARDEAGNAAVDGAGGACRLLRPSAVCSLRQDFDDGAPGWSHSAALGRDAWRIEAPAFARTPPNAWFLPGADEFSDVALVSPVFQVPPRSFLAFWHTYDLESTFDGAVVEISVDGGSWTDLGSRIRRGGYTSVLVPPNPIAGRRAWSGGSIGPMTRVVIDLEDWGSAFAQVRFRAVSDASVGGAGWYVDRVELCQGVREEAQLSLDRASYGCGSKVGVRVLDTGRIGLDGARVEVSSTSEALPEALVLQETTPGSGIFEGAIDLAAADAPGTLLVKEGDAIRALYQDKDNGTGASQDVTAIASIDCKAPEISSVAMEEVTADSALFTWRTDEDAFGKVELGTACNAFAVVAADGAPSKAHRIRATGLSPGAVHFFRLSSTDGAGNTTVDDAGGNCRSFRTRVLFCSFADSLEPRDRAGWDDDGRWRVTENALARSPGHAWVIEGDGRKGEATLTLPVFRASAGSVLELWHAFELANGLSGGIVEGSMDGGETWIDLEPGIIEGGYASFMLPGSALEGRRAWTGGKLGAMTRVRVALDLLGEGELLARLRWASQAIGTEGSWLADDVSVCHAVAEKAFAGFADPVYACEASVTVLLADAGLTGKVIAAVDVTSSRQSAPLSVEVRESAPGFFRGSFVLTLFEIPGGLHALDGDIITVTYADPSDDAGLPVTVQGTASVDCAGPGITNLRVGAASFSTAEVFWETTEPARSRVKHGANCDELSQIAPSGSVTRSHRALLSALEPDTEVAFRVEATDAAGNVASSPSPGCLSLTIRSACGFEDSLEPPRDGWQHMAATGPDDWTLTDFERSHSPTRSFHGPNTGQPKDASLITPPFDVPPGSALSFWHTFELEEGFDGAWLEISGDGGTTWKDLGPEIFEGGYNGSISTTSGAAAGWTGGEIREMTKVSVSLDRNVGPARLVRFRIFTDDSVGTPGWYVDDVSVCTFSSATPSPRFARGNCNADALINLSDAIFLLNHLFLGASTPVCDGACDADRSGALNITDAVFLLDYLFKGGRPLPPPVACDPDLDPGALGCGGEACEGG